MDVSAALMPLTAKVTSFAFCYSDGFKKEEKLSPGKKNK